MDALFTKNVEDKEVYFKNNPNAEGVRQDPLFDVEKAVKNQNSGKGGAQKENV